MKKVIYLENTRKNRTLFIKSLTSKQNTMIVLMTMPQAIHVITAALDMPKGNLEKGARALEIITGCTSNPYVTIAGPVIAGYTTNLTNYNGATPSTRVNLWRKVNNDMKALMRKFQEAADGDPANAIAIIESGNFRIKQVAGREKQKFEAFNGPVSGTVLLTAPGFKGRCCHDWWYSEDRIAWFRMDPTVDAETQKDGLTPAKWAYFRYQLITKDGPQGMSRVIDILVK